MNSRVSMGRMLRPLVASMTTFIACLVLPLVPGPAASDPAGHLRVDGAWVRLPPPGARVTAGYFELHNGGSKRYGLVEVRMDGLRVEMHTVDIDDEGVMRMRRLDDSLEVAPGTTLRFEPGGWHLMVFGTQDWSAGDRVRVELLIADAATTHVLPVDFEVRGP